MVNNFINKLKESKLLGRGGAGFPVWQKWQSAFDVKSDKKYIIANGSEGEPNVIKDWYILQNHFDAFLSGFKLGVETLGKEKTKGIIYLNHKYYDLFSDKILANKGDFDIDVFCKEAGYIGGEETAALNHIEGKLVEPRIKPPYPTFQGLFGAPTVVNNIETFYYVEKIHQGLYNQQRLVTISGDDIEPDVVECLVDDSVEKILKDNNKYPDFDFFIQNGGGASGAIYVPNELAKTKAEGSGAIVIYNVSKTDPIILMERWAHFFDEQNCDKCTPCREGSYRVYEMIKSRSIDYKELFKIFDVMEKTSFCPLGKGISIPFKGLIKKVIKI